MNYTSKGFLLPEGSDFFNVDHANQNAQLANDYIEDLEDGTTAAGNAGKLGGQIPGYYAKVEDVGNKATLVTDDKTNLVSAINEVKEQNNKLESNLTTIQTIPLVEGYYQSRDILPTSTRGNLNVKLFGNTAVNLVNMDINSWIAGNSTISSSNGTLMITGSGGASTAYAKQILKLKSENGKKIFGRAKARVTNANCTQFFLYVYDGVKVFDIKLISLPVQNQWYYFDFSGIATLENTGNVEILIRHYYPDATTANGKVMEVQEVMAIDMGSDSSNPDYNLTADQMNTKYPTYFDGLQGSTGIEVLSVGKNLVDESTARSIETYIAPQYDGKIKLNNASNTSNRARANIKIYLEQGHQYVASKINETIISGTPTSIAISYYNTSSGIKNITSGSSFVFEYPTGIYDICLYTALGSLQNIELNFQLEEDRGQTLGVYEPYKPTSVLYKTLDGNPVTLHRVPNGVCDEIDENGRKVERNVEYELKASDITNITNRNNVAYTNSIPLLDSVSSGISSYTHSAIIVENLTWKADATSTWDVVDGEYCYTLDANQIGTFTLPLNTTLEQAQNILAGLKVVYQRATPSIIDTNATPLIAEPNGTVFISSESSPLPASYMEYTNNVGAVIDGLIEGQKELSEIAIRQNAINLEFDLRLTTLEP